MKKKIITLSIALIVLNLILISASLETKTCRSDCLSNKKLSNENCSSDYDSCRDNCELDRKCISLCYGEKKSCLKIVNSDYLKCSKKCAYLGKNITCLNGKYKGGESFLDKCQVCECSYNSKVSCKKTDFCNFNDILNDKNKCQMNNGLYQQLCNGPYFDIVCSKDYFCLCEGNNNYSCPTDYYCLHSFNPSLTRRSFTIAGWKTLLGVPLGDIGICVKKPLLENCGNGVCEDIIIIGKEAESSINCPTDCN